MTHNWSLILPLFTEQTDGSCNVHIQLPRVGIRLSTISLERCLVSNFGCEVCGTLDFRIHLPGLIKCTWLIQQQQQQLPT